MNTLMNDMTRPDQSSKGSVQERDERVEDGGRPVASLKRAGVTSKGAPNSRGG